MRLRLTIRRHALPDTAIIWEASGEEHSTISTLLEQINQVVPLESPQNNWGLEDYAVELPGYGGSGGGFECLHFQVVGRVLRDDDEVLIRPLLTQDSRMRREGGRDQISSDGMKLIDGVPFGKSRPLQAKRIRRPQVSIPPLKRRRITYDDADESEEELLGENRINGLGGDEDGDRQLVLRANFEDDDEEDDEDFNPGEDVGEQDDDEDDEDDEDFNPKEGDEEDMQLDEDQGDLMNDGPGSDAESSAAEEENPLFDYYDKHGLPKGSINSGKALEHMAKALEGSSKSGARSKKLSKTKGGEAPFQRRGKKVVFAESEIENPGENVEDVNLGGPKESRADAEEDNEESSSDDSDDSNDDASSDESSEDDDDSDDDPPKGPEANHSKDVDSSADEDDSSDLPSTSASSTSSESDSHSDAQPEEVSSKTTTPGTGTSLNTKNTIPQTPSVQAPKNPPQPTVPPHQGTRSTKARNERRRNTNAMERMKKKGILPAGITLEQYNKFGLSKVSTMDEAQEALQADVDVQSDVASEVNSKSAKKSKMNAEFEARRKQLLESLASGGIEVGPETPKVRPSMTAQAPADAEGDVEMGNAISPTAVLPQNEAEGEGNPKEAPTFLANGSPPVPLTGEPADQDIETPNATLSKPHTPYNPPLGRENCLKGLTFVFTGQLESMSRNQGHELVTKYGGKVRTTPSLKTNYVVLGSDVGETKLRKIEEMKLNTIDQKGLFELIAKSVSASEGKPVAPSGEIPETPASEVISTTKDQTPNTALNTPDSDVQARRSKLDVGAGRRMLFGALGIKNPKTKADEEKVRNDLMKLARPAKAVEEPAVPEVPEIAEDPDAWREKINLRAVECCHEGVELSEPPFPFVQRWDPQQQGSWPSKGGRGGKRKRNKRDRAQYYDNEPSEKSNQRKRQKSWNYEDYDYSFNLEEEQNYGNGDEMELNYDEPPQTNNDEAHEAHDSKAMDVGEVMDGDTQATDMDDLPSLPSDLSTLPRLNAGDAKAGMTIAFKHLIMGPNYQPQYSEYRTAVIYKVEDSGDLELRLAKRDREQKEYDPDTGERIFGQFEMPVDDDDAEDEDDGALYLSYSELVEPLVVQDAPDDLLVVEDLEPKYSMDENLESKVPISGNQTTSGDAEDGQNHDLPNEDANEESGEKQASTDNSTTVDHEKAEHSPQKSGGTPFDQDSPMKSIEDNIEEETLHKPLEVLTEDLLQKSAEGSFLEAKGETNLAEGAKELSPKDGTPPRTLHDGDQLEVDVQVVEQISLSKEDRSTSPLSTDKEDRSTSPLTPSRNNELEHDIQVQQTGSKDPNRDELSNPHTGLDGADSSNDVQVEDSFLGQQYGQQDEDSTPRPTSRSYAQNSAHTSPKNYITESTRQDQNSTPRPKVRTHAANSAQTSPNNSITESARHDVSIMMRDAGFRSEIPSSILRGNQLNVQNTPGDAAVFEKLMREMAPDTDRNSYSSPQFKGFASSSPIKGREEKDVEMSPTPVTWEKPTFESPESNPPQATSQSIHTGSGSVKYPKLQDLSSYTSPGDHGRQPDLISHADDSFHPFDEFDSLINRQDEESSLVRAEAEEFPSAQPRRDSEFLPQDPSDPVESQPASKLNDTPPPMPEHQSLLRRSPSPQLPENRRVSSSSKKDVKKKKKKAVTPEPVSDFFPSSDSPMPTLEEVLSQQPRIKSEPRGSQPQFTKSKMDEEYEKSMAQYDAMYDSEPDDFPIDAQTPPKGRNRTSSFQKPALPKKENRRASASQVPRASQPPPRPSQASKSSQAPKSSQALKPSQPPRPSQAPPGSQMIDLTLSSSDAEPEADFSTAPDEIYHDEEKDSDYQYTGPMGSGWAAKKVTTRGKSLEPAKARRVTSGVDGFDERGRVSSTQDIPSTKWVGGKGRRGDGVKEEGRRRATGRF